jgi:hypothetical protein
MSGNAVMFLPSKILARVLFFAFDIAWVYDLKNIKKYTTQEN